MRIKGLNLEQLEKKLNYLEKTSPKSRWVKYIQYNIKRLKRGN